MAVQRPGLPHEPEVKVQHTWRVGQSGHHLALDWNPVAVYFLVKWLAENDDVLITEGRERSSLVLVKPKLKAIEKVESRPVEDEFTFWFIVASEEDDGRENALESLHDAVRPLTVLEEAEKVEHLRRFVESHNPAALTHRERSHPDWNEAVLPEGQSELRMTEDLKEEFSIASRVKQLVSWRSAERESAEHEGAGVKSELLLAAFALFPDEFDRFDLFQPALADAEERLNRRKRVVSPVSHTTCGGRH